MKRILINSNKIGRSESWVYLIVTKIIPYKHPLLKEVFGLDFFLKINKMYYTVLPWKGD